MTKRRGTGKGKEEGVKKRRENTDWGWNGTWLGLLQIVPLRSVSPDA